VPERSALHILKDCTWCKHRRSLKNAIQNRYELETCKLTGKPCAPPTQSLLRRCERFQMTGCNCPDCKTG
jgi:hypothetical protein